MLTYQRFATLSDAEEIAEIFTSNGVAAVVEDAAPCFDPALTGNALSKEYLVKIAAADFDRASRLMAEDASGRLDTIPRDYYLFDFTDEELLDLISKQDEWGALDFLLAQKILKERGSDISPERLDEMKNARLNDLSQPEKITTPWLFTGYLFSFGGFVGILCGLYLMSSKKTLPDGSRIYTYSKTDRKHGRLFIVLGVLSLSVWSIWKIYSQHSTGFFSY